MPATGITKGTKLSTDPDQYISLVGRRFEVSGTGSISETIVGHAFIYMSVATSRFFFLGSGALTQSYCSISINGIQINYHNTASRQTNFAPSSDTASSGQSSVVVYRPMLYFKNPTIEINSSYDPGVVIGYTLTDEQYNKLISMIS